MRLILSIFVILLASIQNLWAVRAYPYPITISEPNGAKVTILLHGNEFFHYATTLDGRVIAKDKEGFYCFADYEGGKINISSQRISSSPLSPIVKFSPFKSGSFIDEIPPETIKLIENANKKLKLSPAGEISCKTELISKLKRILVIPVEFSDLKFFVDNPEMHFHRMLNQPRYSDYGGTGSAADYFEDNIPDINIQFDVTPKVTLPNKYSYYGNNDDNTPSVIIYDKNVKQMIKDACRAVDEYVDFSRYDNDNDGSVDYVFIYYAGYNEAESGFKETIWPQTGDVSNNNYKFDGKTLSVYGCSSELCGSEGEIPAGIGTFCHELSHYFGLKDLYDTDSGKGGLSKGLWKNLSIMDSGNYNNNGRTPPYYCAIDRELLNTLNYERLIIDSLTYLTPINESSTALKISTTNKDEYFLMENRYEEDWDQYIGGSGMIIYHIDKSLNNVNGIQAKVRWDNNIINTFAEHECADLIEAYNDAIDINQVFYPGQANISEFNTITDPPFIDWDGNSTGYRLTQIEKISRYIRFYVRIDTFEVLLVPKNCRVENFQRRALVEWDCKRAGHYTWGVEWWNVKDNDTMKATTNNNRYIIKKLEPKENYSCMVYHIGKHSNGDTARVNISTTAITSPYPRIEKTAENYKVGDRIHLLIENLSEETESIIWFVNDVKIYTDYYKFRTSGRYLIKAVVKYSSDKSEEIFLKNIMVDEEVYEK